MQKFLKVLAAVALITCAAPASAQFTGGGTSSGNVAKSYSADTNPYSRFSLSYDNTHLGANDKMDGWFNGEDAMSLNGVGLEYIHGFSVSKTLPMFVEAGIKVQFGVGSVSDEVIDDINLILQDQQMSFSVPVNYTYRFPVGDGMSIAPYLGINFKVHALARMREKVDDDDVQDYLEDEYKDFGKWMSVFDKDKMDKDGTWNRFQMGWQIGAGLNVKAFYIGLQYGTDFIPAFKYKKYAINTGNFAVKIGYNF